MKKLGIIGGMGSQATAFFFNRIIENTEATKDQEHINMVILNHSTLPDRTKIILSGDYKTFEKAIIEDIKKLEYIGVDNIAIPCNTSHFFYDNIQNQTHIPIINMVKETVKYILENNSNIKKIGIMATDGTIYTKIYENECKLNNISAVLPSKEKQKIVMSIIYDEIKNGKKGSLNKFIEVVDELRYKGCEAIILACTELSYFKEYHKIPDYCIDSMDILVLKSIELSGKHIKSNSTLNNSISTKVKLIVNKL